MTPIAEAVAAERRRFVTLVRATCACQRCKDDAANLLAAAPDAEEEPMTTETTQEAEILPRGPAEEHRAIDVRALLLLIAEEVDRQDRNHPAGYPFDRNGLRLGIAALEDEVQEVYEEWRQHKRDLGNGAESIRAELLQVMGVAFRIVREIDAVAISGGRL